MNMELPIYQVDAFADRVFAGNPAAVAPLERWLPDATLQAIAAENNLAETAFLVPDGDVWEIVWFTPTVEAPLCGHATLASAYVVTEKLRPGTAVARFRTRTAGDLTVTRDGATLTLDFPSRPPREATPPAEIAGLGGPKPQAVLTAADFWFAIYETEEEVGALAPDMATLARAEGWSFCVTAPGRDVDFVSRMFGPAIGIPEDPVTGSTHCSLTPYWAERLGRSHLKARQLSPRGGELLCETAGDRVKISGAATLYMEGRIFV